MRNCSHPRLRGATEVARAFGLEAPPRSGRTEGHLFLCIEREAPGALVAPDHIRFPRDNRRPGETAFVLARLPDKTAWRYWGVARHHECRAHGIAGRSRPGPDRPRRRPDDVRRSGGILDEPRVNRLRYLEGTPKGSTRWIDTGWALLLVATADSAGTD